jgi:hypothetical protein
MQTYILDSYLQSLKCYYAPKQFSSKVSSAVGNKLKNMDWSSMFIEIYNNEETEEYILTNVNGAPKFYKVVDIIPIRTFQQSFSQLVVDCLCCWNILYWSCRDETSKENISDYKYVCVELDFDTNISKLI